MTETNPYIHITEAPIDVGGVYESLAHPESGAAVVFIGRVRNHNDGQSIHTVSYSAYLEMAEEELLRIDQLARKQFPILQSTLIHRIGTLTVGEISIAVGVASAHRDVAFDAARFLIDTIKKQLPVWKEETTTSGEIQWPHNTPSS